MSTAASPLVSWVQRLAGQIQLKKRQQELLLRCGILGLIWILAFAVRLVGGEMA